ncbi:short chain dehydrogenase [Candidatus Marinamargulisbacteria bacterium SCGC AG-414-C22]|nr:short chain dehydrogenase [Candidatus Marinamargulisbacteria bacterium SCGC AG-414-C22]
MKRIIIVGGSSGIGLNIAKQLITINNVEVLIASKSKKSIEKAKKILGDSVKSYVLDATQEASVIQFFNNIGNFDHLITTIKHEHVNSLFTSPNTMDALHAFNNKFWGQYYCAKHCLSTISNKGSIILTSGIASQKGYKGFSTTAAINGAIESLVKTLAIELNPIRINAVSPSFIERFPNDLKRLHFAKGVEPKLTQLVSLDDISKIYLSLLENSNKTGEIIYGDIT